MVQGLRFKSLTAKNLTSAAKARILTTNKMPEGMKMNRTPFTAAYFYFGYYRFGNGSVCCETARGAK